MPQYEREMSSHNDKHCCETMEVSLQEPGTFGIYYSKKYREYTVDVNGVGFKMKYCPACGTKFLPSLRKEWFKELEKILDTEISLTMDKRKIPREFKTDEWWKNRGL
jgi:ribosomal protein S27AE